MRDKTRKVDVISLQKLRRNQGKTQNKKTKTVFFFILLTIGFISFLNEAFASEVIAGWTFPSNSSVADLGNNFNVYQKNIISVGAGAPSFDVSGASTFSARATGWNDGGGKKYWQVEFKATGYETLRVSSKQRSSSTGPRDFHLQYKIGAEGEWLNVPGATVITADNFTAGFLSGVVLPSNCDDQDSVYLRWIMTSNIAVNGLGVSSLGSNRIDDIIVTGDPIIEEPEAVSDTAPDVNQNNQPASVYAGLTISEIMYDPIGSNTQHAKWVELVNVSDQKIILKSSQTSSGWKIKDLKLTDSSNHYLYAPNNSSIEINPGDFLIIANNPDNFIKDYPDLENIVILKSALTLTNATGFYKLTLFDNAFILDTVFYSKNWGAYNNGKSLEKIDLIAENSADNWRESCFDGGTPGQENYPQAMCPAEEADNDSYVNYDYQIRLNEILPVPKGDKKTDSYIELYNGEDFDINLENWSLKNNAKSSKFVFPEGYVLKSGNFLVIYRKDFKFALKTADTISLLDPDDNLVSSASYLGARKEISYGFNGKNWKWSKFLTPGDKNKFSETPQIKIKAEKNAYVGMPILFSAETKKVTKKDEKNLKYQWDFGNGRKSYLKETKHTYLKKGRYHVVLTVNDGLEKITRELILLVKEYPKFKLELIGLSPNPANTENEGEWIEIKNNSSKKVNLQGWKVATGPVRPVNHIIFSDFEIASGETKRITREDALFSLNNKGTQVELRYPNGKTVDTVSYFREKIAKGEIYKKVNGRWNWIKKEPDPAIETEGNEEKDENENMNDEMETDEELKQETMPENGQQAAEKTDQKNSENNGQVMGMSFDKQDDDDENEKKDIQFVESNIPSKRWPVRILISLRDSFNYFFDSLIILFG